MARKSNMPTIPPDMYCFSKLKTADCTIRFIKPKGATVTDELYLECSKQDRHVQVRVYSHDFSPFLDFYKGILSADPYSYLLSTYENLWIDGPLDEWIFRDPWKSHIIQLIRQWMHQKQSAYEIDFDLLANEICAACSMPNPERCITALKRILPYLFKDCQQIGSGQRGFSCNLTDHESLPEFMDATRHLTFSCFAFQNFTRDVSPRWELTPRIDRIIDCAPSSREISYRSETVNRFAVKLTHREIQQIVQICMKAFGYSEAA